MIFSAKTLAAGLMMSAVAVAAGCSDRGSSPGGPEVVQAGYPAEDTYYTQGSYQGDYWVWRDRDGHEQREARADHERRANVRSDRGAVDAGRRDNSNEHRDAINNNDRRDAVNNDHRDAANGDHHDVAQPNRPQDQNTNHGDAHQTAPGHGPQNEGRPEAGREGQKGGDAAAGHGDENGVDRR